MSIKLLFGTNNTHKLKEIREILSDITVLSLADLMVEMEVEETEDTLRDNAILKAKAYFEVSGLPCFADDTGLEVDALDGAPGVYSARYAGPNCNPDDNIDKLLGALKDADDRQARFKTVIAFVDGGKIHTFEGIAEGRILKERRGSRGFGYDPIFLPEGFRQSFAEMSPGEKNNISHRGKAIQKFAEFMSTYGKKK